MKDKTKESIELLISDFHIYWEEKVNNMNNKEDLIVYGGHSVITKEDLEIYSFCIKYGLNYDEIYSKIKSKNK